MIRAFQSIFDSRRALVALSVLFCLCANAESNGTELPQGEEQLLSAIFPPSCHFSGQFQQQKHVEGIAFPLVSSGDFFYSCDLGLVWNTQKPFQDAMLYANASASFRVNEQGEIEPLTGTARYIMSSVFIRLLEGDTAYFAEEFDVSFDSATGTTVLIPNGEFMRRGLQQIAVQKTPHENQQVSLHTTITDITGQNTVIRITETDNYLIDGKKAAFEECQKLYPSPLKWCRVLRSRDFYARP